MKNNKEHPPVAVRELAGLVHVEGVL